MKVKDFIAIAFSCEAVRNRFKDYILEVAPDVTLSTEKDINWLKVKLRGFCSENPECFSKALV